jgi:hypothetical protein
MKRTLLFGMCLFLAVAGGGLSAQSMSQYLVTLEKLAPFYAPLAQQTVQQGFFQEAVYERLRTALEGNKKFQAEVLRSYASSDAFFQSFHDYTLAYSCYTFRQAMGSKFPEDYYAELDVSAKKLKEALATKGIDAGQKTRLEESLVKVQLFQKRIREYQAAFPLVKRETLDVVSTRAADMDVVYAKVFVVK